MPEIEDIRSPNIARARWAIKRHLIPRALDEYNSSRFSGITLQTCYEGDSDITILEEGENSGDPLEIALSTLKRDNADGETSEQNRQAKYELTLEKGPEMRFKNIVNNIAEIRRSETSSREYPFSCELEDDTRYQITVNLRN